MKENPQDTFNRNQYNNAIYAIIDNVAETIVGSIYLQKHEAAAIRFFADVASMPESIVAKHPQDFDLVRIGYITHDNHIHPDYTMVLKGSAWATATEPKLVKEG